jgi:hypothetical protein
MYRTLILNNAVYIALLIILIALAIKIVRAYALKEYNDRLGLFFSSFRFYGKPILRNMISKPKQEYLRFNNKLNAVTYIALLSTLVLYSIMNAI